MKQFSCLLVSIILLTGLSFATDEETEKSLLATRGKPVQLVTPENKHWGTSQYVLSADSRQKQEKNYHFLFSWTQTPGEHYKQHITIKMHVPMKPYTEDSNNWLHSQIRNDLMVAIGQDLEHSIPETPNGPGQMQCTTPTGQHWGKPDIKLEGKEWLFTWTAAGSNVHIMMRVSATPYVNQVGELIQQADRENVGCFISATLEAKIPAKP